VVDPIKDLMMPDKTVLSIKNPAIVSLNSRTPQETPKRLPRTPKTVVLTNGLHPGNSGIY
jgi:hypothetical protein